MGLRQGSYAKVWCIKQNGKTYSGQISVSKKNKETNEYETQFNGYVKFAGPAAEKAANFDLPETMDREHPKYESIHITDSPDIASWFNKEEHGKKVGLIKRLANKAGVPEDNEGVVDLIKCVGRACDTKPITIWDFEIPDNEDEGSAKKSKSASKKGAESKAKAETDDEAEEEYPF